MLLFGVLFEQGTRAGHLATEALLNHLVKKSIYHRVLTTNNRLSGLFIAYPESIKHLQSNFDVILIDNTYSINRFNMPLMDVIGLLFYYSISCFKTILISLGIDNNSKTFYICFAFLPDQKEESYTWALGCIKELFNKLNTPTIIIGPSAIATDCDQALRNAVSIVFSESPALLCAWHANKNVQQRCKPIFDTTKAWETFQKAWYNIVSSKTIQQYEERLDEFTRTYSNEPARSCVKYIKETWLKPGRKESLKPGLINIPTLELLLLLGKFLISFIVISIVISIINS